MRIEAIDALVRSEKGEKGKRGERTTFANVNGCILYSVNGIFSFTIQCSETVKKSGKEEKEKERG